VKKNRHRLSSTEQALARLAAHGRTEQEKTMGSGNATAFRDARELVSFLATTLGARHAEVDPA
jgi:hypothetical protein